MRAQLWSCGRLQGPEVSYCSRRASPKPRVSRFIRAPCRRFVVVYSTESIPSKDAPEPDDLLEIGVFLSPHGLQGEIRLQATTDFPKDRLPHKAVRWVQGQARGQGQGQLTKVDVEGGRPSVYKGHDIWLMRVAGITTPEQASALRNHRLLMLATEVPQLQDDDEFYSQELIGMQVVHWKSGAAIGHVMDVYDGTGTQNVLRVRLEGPKSSCLIPFVKEIVPVVDTAARIMHITPPEGLLELATSAAKPHRKPKQTLKGSLLSSKGPMQEAEEF